MFGFGWLDWDMWRGFDGPFHGPNYRSRCDGHRGEEGKRTWKNRLNTKKYADGRQKRYQKNHNRRGGC